jgi:protein SCO1/2
MKFTLSTARSRTSIIPTVLALGVLAFSGGAATAQNSRGLAPKLDTGASASASGAMLTPADQVIEKVRWDQKLGNALPLDATFKDETGQTVQLKKYFRGEKPVVLMLIFYNCTMLCSEVMNGALRLFQDPKKELGFVAGRDFEVVTISINPNEGPELAAGKKKTYVASLKGSPDAQKGWHLLTGEDAQIKRVADAIGYRYTLDKQTQQYAHPGGLVMATPHGEVSRYAYGIDYPGKTVRYGLIEASQGRIGSPLERVALFTCFHYNPVTGTYSLALMKILQLAALMTVLGLGTGVWLMKRWENKRQDRGATPSAPAAA